jgi:hypothetical protein
MTTTERDDWESLLGSPGWLRFLAYAKAQYAGETYARRIKSAITHALEHKLDVSAAVQVVDAESNAVNALVSYPAMRIKELLHAEAQRSAEPPISRRGVL